MAVDAAVVMLMMYLLLSATVHSVIFFPKLLFE